MSYYLIVQYPYETIEIALCKNGLVVSSTSFHKHQAIGQTIPAIEQLLSSASITLKDLSCIGVNVGPGPYNTLRGILTMMNGIARVNGTSLLAFNALDLMSSQFQDTPHVVILTAFEGHVFFNIRTKNLKIQAAGTVSYLIELINEQPEQLQAYGNGAIKYQQELENGCPAKLKFTEPITHFNSLTTLAQRTYERYVNKNQSENNLSDYLKPIYFEDLAAQSKKNI